MILVTGGTGLIGSHLLLQLVQDHDKIRAIRRPASNIQHVRNVFSLYRQNADELYEKIRWLAYKEKRSQNSIIVDMLQQKLEYVRVPEEAKNE